MAIGKIVHLGVDLVILSAALAGIRRSTGLRVKTEGLTDSKTFAEYMDKYLAVGETTVDLAAAQMSSFPKYFTRD
ncbi:hypothetical protein GGF46_004061 [Coemansia sp. RSA 552]|nr:hypothetical protein GGF46_004061 [Coemansia sp. RSA 552]